MNVQKIYFDMDGVLADFDRGVRELCHLPGYHQMEMTKEQDDVMWTEIRKVEHFYNRLEPMPGSIEMFQKLYLKYGDKCEILTGIPKEKRGIKNAGEDKIIWVHERLGKDIMVNVVYKEEKKNFCKGSGYILIDDLEVNIQLWQSYGGMGILHKNSEDTIMELTKLGVL